LIELYILLLNIVKKLNHIIKDDYWLSNPHPPTAAIFVDFSISIRKVGVDANPRVRKRINKSLKIESIIGITVLIVASFLSVTSPPSLEAVDQSSNSFQNPDNTDIGNSNGSFFSYLVITLVIIITIIGIINFKKNHKQIKAISALTR
jgi:hypothetical protein